MKFKTINPATEEVITEFETMPKKQVMNIANDVNKAFLKWKEIPLDKKTQYFKRLANVLRSNKEEYGKIMSLEMGKPIKDAMGEIEKYGTLRIIYKTKRRSYF